MTKSTGIFVVKKTNKKHTETIEKKIWINDAPIKRKWHRTQVWGSNNKQEGLGEAQQRAKPYNFPPRGLKTARVWGVSRTASTNSHPCSILK